MAKSTREEYPFRDSDLPPISHYELQDYDQYTSPHDIEEQDQPYRQDTAEALRMLLAWMLAAKTAATIGARALLLSNIVGISHEQNRNYSTIAEAAGISREAVRLYSEQIEQFAGIRTALSRTDSTRKACRRSRLKAINKAT